MNKNKKRWVVSFWKFNAHIEKKATAYFLAKLVAIFGFKVKLADRSSFKLHCIENELVNLFRKTPL